MFASIRNAASRGYLKAGVLAVTLVPALAMATPTDPFDTAVDSITTKVEGYGAALVGLSAVALVFFIGIKYVKKIRGAA